MAVRDGVDVSGLDVRAMWCDPSTSSEAQAVDAAVKLYSVGLLSRTGTLARLGFSQDEIAAELGGLPARCPDGPRRGCRSLHDRPDGSLANREETRRA